MKVVIFGTAPQSSVTWHMLTRSRRYEVLGFTVDAAYRDVDTLHDLPVVAFEAVETFFPPASCRMIAPLGWKGMNRLRERKVREARDKGYELLSFVADNADVAPEFIALPNTIIQERVVIAPFSTVGANCSIRTGSIVSHHVTIGDSCLIAPGVTISGCATIGERSVLGTGCIVRDSIKVAPGCFIGAGAVVVRDTRENGTYFGVPARLLPTPADQLQEVA